MLSWPRSWLQWVLSKKTCEKRAGGWGWRLTSWRWLVFGTKHSKNDKKEQNKTQPPIFSGTNLLEVEYRWASLLSVSDDLYGKMRGMFLSWFQISWNLVWMWQSCFLLGSAVNLMDQSGVQANLHKEWHGHNLRVTGSAGDFQLQSSIQSNINHSPLSWWFLQGGTVGVGAFQPTWERFFENLLSPLWGALEFTFGGGSSCRPRVFRFAQGELQAAKSAAMRQL